MMKRLFTLFLGLSLAFSSFAQAKYNLIVFSEDGRTFDLYVNSIKQNVEPSANVRVTDLNSPNAIVKVAFNDGETPDVQQTMYFQTPNTEVTARIKQTKKGLKLRYFGEVPLAQAQPEMESDVRFTTVIRDEPEEVVFTSTEYGNEPEVIETTTTVTTTTESVEMNTGIKEDGDKIDVNISLGGIGISMDVDVDMNTDMDVEETMTTTTTTTTTSTSGGSVNNDAVYVDHVIMPDVPCSTDINPIRTAIEGESFQDDRLDVAKMALKGKCVSVAQVKELASLFTFSDNKLEFVKYAYDYTGDTDNYYQLNSAFTFSSDKDELKEFLESK